MTKRNFYSIEVCRNKRHRTCYEAFRWGVLGFGGYGYKKCVAHYETFEDARKVYPKAEVIDQHIHGPWLIMKGKEGSDG